MLEEIVSKKCEKKFLKKHMNIVTKNGRKKSEKKILPESNVYRDQKTIERNRLEKVRKHVFYKHTNIVTKKWGKKREEKIVKKHTNRVSKIFWKKIVWKKCENTFFIDTRIS